jgi:hypothetical protein
MSLIVIKLVHLTAVHPKTDDDTECANRTLKQYLPMFVSPPMGDWVRL